MIKHLDPKAERATEFCRRYGILFEWVGATLWLSLLTGEILDVRIMGGAPMVNGMPIEW